MACGVGSVGKGPDYKVLRIYQQIHLNEGEVDDEGELNIIKIWEDIWNPSFPMALRLFGMLMVWNDAADEVLERHHQEKGTQQSAESKDVNLEQKKHRITRRRAKKLAALVMDYDQTIITGHEYEYWPQDPSDLRRERKLERPSDRLSTMKIRTAMELPSTVVTKKLFTNGRVYYPKPLMESILPPHDSPSGFHSGVGSLSTRISIEKQRAEESHNEIHNEILIDELRNNLENNASSKRRPFSASMNIGNGLKPVAEDLAWDHADPNFMLSNLSKNNSTPDYDLLVETGPTQTQRPLVIDLPLDQITDAIRIHFKNHIYTPGCAKVESLNQFALGMNKKRSAGSEMRSPGTTSSSSGESKQQSVESEELKLMLEALETRVEILLEQFEETKQVQAQLREMMGRFEQYQSGPLSFTSALLVIYSLSVRGYYGAVMKRRGFRAILAMALERESRLVLLFLSNVYF
ncbi:hypothetical protein OROMI_031919 [Orobanche minor]